MTCSQERDAKARSIYTGIDLESVHVTGGYQTPIDLRGTSEARRDGTGGGKLS